MSKYFPVFLAVFAVSWVGGYRCGETYEKKHYQKLLIQVEMAKWTVNPKTGEKKFELIYPNR